MTNFSFGQLIIVGGLPDDLTKQHYTYKIDTTKVNKDSVFVLVKQFENDTLTFQEEQIFLPAKIIFHGHSIQWHKNGQKKCEGTFNLGKQNNDWKYWDRYGKQVPQEFVSSDINIRGSNVFYVDGKKVDLKPTKSNCVSSFDSTLQGQVYSLADKMPEYSGGTSALLSFFSKNFIYPKDQEEFQGSIYITFIIEADGKTSNIGIYRKYYGDSLSSVDKEAIRVFKLMPSWTPGQCEGKNVPIKMTIPIKF
jgi:hypothetical protein